MFVCCFGEQLLFFVCCVRCEGSYVVLLCEGTRKRRVSCLVLRRELALLGGSFDSLWSNLVIVDRFCSGFDGGFCLAASLRRSFDGAQAEEPSTPAMHHQLTECSG